MRILRNVAAFVGGLLLYALVLVTVHEIGHTVLARLLGDPESTFYLFRLHPGGGVSIGFNAYDHTKLSPAANMLVGLGGLMFTQAAAWLSLGLLRRASSHARWGRILALAAWGFVADLIVQVIQGLVYDFESLTWPTAVDLTDVMILLSESTGAKQAVLKTLLAVVTVTYLALFRWAYRAARSPSSRAESSRAKGTSSNVAQSGQ